MNIKIPDKYREEFDRSADFAVRTGKFTVKELASELEMGELAASIMVGYMEKTGLVTKGKLDDVRRAKISLEEWERLERKIENYEPLPDPEPEKFHTEAKEISLTLEDVIPEGLAFYKKEISAKESFIILKGQEEVRINVDDISAVFLIKPRLFKKGALVFSAEKELGGEKLSRRADTVLFGGKDFEKAEKLALAITERLGITLNPT
ncbi:MAG: hypothetical protein IJ323_01845 [Clostridia bacterium]|nr:hypothetical protein [Clostridia bacterium]